MNYYIYDLAVIHKEDQAYQVKCRTDKPLPQIIKQDDVGRLTDEWKIYQGQDIPEDCYITGHQGDVSNIYRRVYHYWRRVFETQNSTGSPRYYVLPKFVKAVLCLTHGNADVERRLSENSKVLTSERCLLSDDYMMWVSSHEDTSLLQNISIIT